MSECNVFILFKLSLYLHSLECFDMSLIMANYRIEFSLCSEFTDHCVNDYVVVCSEDG